MKKGIVKSINIDKFAAYMSDYVDKAEKDTWGHIIKDNDFLNKAAKTLSIDASSHGSLDRSRSVERYIEDWDKTQYSNRDTTEFERKLNYLKKQVAYAEEYGQPLSIDGIDDEYVYLDFEYYSKDSIWAYYAIPREFCEVELFADYSDTPVAAIGTNSVTGAFPSVPDKTENSIRTEIEGKQEELEHQAEEIKAKEAEMREEIEKMKKEIELKYKSTFDLLAQKKAELDLQKQQLESELFVLDAQIYGIRCHNGEVIKFTQLTSGKREDTNTPLVIYQKIRFLDEELSKYVALYNFNGSDANQNTFEELIKARSDLRDLFFPNGKSVSLVRITRDNTAQSSGQRVFMDGVGVYMQNVIEEYQVFHGTKIAILLRDGDNCYIGWTDDERFIIDDGNAFLTPESHTKEYNEPKREWYDTKEEETRTIRTNKNVVASRYYLFSAIQGVIDNGLINLPEGVSIVKNSNYIVFSMADNWLTDKGYGSLSDILEKYTGKYRVGDDILTTQSLRAETGKYTDNNDRGIGYNNRTHDVRCDDNTIYPINHIEKTDTFIAHYTYNGKRDYSLADNGFGGNRFTNVEEFLESRYSKDDYTDVTVEPYEKRDIYVSLEKEGYYFWDDTHKKKSRANFNLFEDEFIPLTFLNSDFIKNVLVTRNLGSAFSRYNFSTSIKYLNHMIEYLTNREETEEKLIAAELNDTLPVDWRVRLSDWKIENDVHNFTEYQAKRFVKTLV